MSSSERLFRNSVFGGFNKDDVIDYIENMKNEFFEYRSQVEQTVKELNKKIAALESEAKAAKQKAAEADKRAADAVESSELPPRKRKPRKSLLCKKPLLRKRKGRPTLLGKSALQQTVCAALPMKSAIIFRALSTEFPKAALP